MALGLCERTILVNSQGNASFMALEHLKETYRRKMLVEQRKPPRQQNHMVIKDAYHNIALIEKKQRKTMQYDSVLGAIK